MAQQASDRSTPDQKALDLRNLYRPGIPPERDVIHWKTVGLHLALVLTIALAVRLPYYSDGWRPLNDGGMFALILDYLRTHGMRWPLFIDYNHLHIPLGYPPLGFYLGALATFLPMQNTLLVMTWFPLAFNLATVVAAYFIAHEIFEDSFLRVMTAIIFSVIGWGSMWLTMGGGITRSPGEFFALTTIALFLRSCNLRSLKLTIWTGVFGGLTLITHLESSVLIVVSLPVLALSFPRRWENLARMVAAGCVGTVVTLPWVLWIWTHLGFGPLGNAFHSGFDVAHYDFSIVLVAISGVILAWAARFPYQLWLVTEFLLMRRNPGTHSVVIRAIVIAWIATVIVAILFKSLRSKWWRNAISAVIAIAMALPMLGVIQKKSQRLDDLDKNPRAQASVTEIEAMQAAPKYSAPDARFIVLSERTEYWFEDFASEWFPYYSGRQCLNTVQGREWLPNRDFYRATRESASLLSLEPPPNFDDLIYRSEPDYLMIIRPMDESHEAVTGTYKRLTQGAPVYQNRDVQVFAFDKQKIRLAAAGHSTATGPQASKTPLPGISASSPAVAAAPAAHPCGKNCD
jgi:hypothetical protein